MCCIWSKFLTQMSAAFANELAPSVTGLSCWSLAQVALQPCPEVKCKEGALLSTEGHWLQVKGSNSMYGVQLEVLCGAGGAAGSHSKGRGWWEAQLRMGTTWNGRKFRSPFPPWPDVCNCLDLSYATSILWNGGFLFAGPCRNQVSTVPVNIVREQNHASHCCGSHTKLSSSPGFSSVFCKAHHWVCSSLLLFVHQLN